MKSYKIAGIVLDVAIIMLGMIVAFFSGWLILQQQDITEKGVQEVNTVAIVNGKAALLESRVGAAAKNGVDAAMVEFPMSNGMVRRYIMVVMTSDPSSYTILTRLGEMLEAAILYV